MSYIEMKMQSNRTWGTSEKARMFAKILASQDDFTLPEKFDQREPERIIFNPDRLDKFIEIWTSEIRFVSLKRKKPFLAWYTIQMLLSREYELLNEILCGFDERYMQKDSGPDKLLERAKAIYGWGDVLHGYICHDQDWNQKNYFGVPTEIAGGKIVSTGGLKLKGGLPGIYWANFFGPRYVEFFGKDRFQSVPAYYKEMLEDGGYLLLTSQSPLEYNGREVLALQKEIIDHLGREAFFEKANPRKKCRVPAFDYDQ